jgi:hypothetical protein
MYNTKHDLAENLREQAGVYTPTGVRRHVIGSPESFTHTAKDLPFTTTNRRQYESTDIS